ncbi:MAG: hypothetical protein GX804_04245 [Lentisphaerae bacterium]|jgi:uncharacterized membrane protein YsdA (DUF1294 family)|nr:hypothetical protein [Lentisphaerota bacterium]
MAFWIWIVIINSAGFLMVEQDFRRMKARKMRSSTSGFIWNVLLGGGSGQLLAMIMRRHIPEAAMSVSVTLFVIAAQVAGVIYSRTPEGQQQLKKWNLNAAKTSIETSVEKTKSFLEKIDRSTGKSARTDFSDD